MVFLMQMVKLVPAMSLFPLYDHFKRVLPGPFSKYIGCLNNESTQTFTLRKGDCAMVFLMQMVKLVPVMVLFPLYDHFKRVLPGPFSKYIGYLSNESI